MAAADVQQLRDDIMQPYASEEEEAPVISRTESQVQKQLEVHRVQQRLAGQQQPVRELLAAASSQACAGGPAAALEEILRQQKAARNIGEDLLEDMLKLDSLAGLYQEDREVRKIALSQLDELVDKVDAAKAQLLKRRKELEAEVATADEPQSPPPAVQEDAPSPARPGDEKPEETDIRCRLQLRSRELPQGYVVSADAPGLAAQDVKLELDGNLLRVAGVVRPSAQDAALLTRRLRRQPTAQDYAAHGFGHFQEAVRVPADVDAGNIQASCRNGQLQLLLPRRPQQPFARGCRTTRARPPMFPVW